MKKLFFLLTLSVILVSCGEPQKDVSIQPVNDELVNIGYPDTAVVESIRLTGGKYQSFIVYYRYVKNDAITLERTRMLYYKVS